MTLILVANWPAVRCQSVTIEDTSTTTKTVSIIAPVSIIASIAPSHRERETQC